MPSTIRKVSYAYVTAASKPGEAARILGPQGSVQTISPNWQHMYGEADTIRRPASNSIGAGFLGSQIDFHKAACELPSTNDRH